MSDEKAHEGPQDRARAALWQHVGATQAQAEVDVVRPDTAMVVRAIAYAAELVVAAIREGNQR